jgi:DNA ligase-1
VSQNAPLMYAQNWNQRQDLTGWWLSEKMDGIRAFWNGEVLLSKKGKIIQTPDFFTSELPKIQLDGELWLGRNMYEQLISIQNQINSDWKKIKYVLFDLPNVKGSYEFRIQELKKLKLPQHVRIVEPIKCESLYHIEQFLNQIIQFGGEGLMAHHPTSDYIIGRTSTILKIKVILFSSFLKM